LKKLFLLFIICLFFYESNGQDCISLSDKVYRFKRKTEIPITLVLWALDFYGASQLSNKPKLDTFQINSLNKNDIWAFDRIAVKQSYPAPSQVYNISDWGLWLSYCMPAILFLDDKIRQNWLDITLLYLKTQAINYNLYAWGGPVFTKRIRPLVYYSQSSWDYKLGKGTTDSFFSGHASMSAGASFFIAKVLSDYHPELGAKKWWLFAAVLIPPAFVGYYRYRGFMHYPSDLLIGTAIGAAVGITIPQLHKITKNKNKDVSFLPFTGNYTGVVMSIRF